MLPARQRSSQPDNRGLLAGSDEWHQYSCSPFLQRIFLCLLSDTYPDLATHRMAALWEDKKPDCNSKRHVHCRNEQRRREGTDPLSVEQPAVMRESFALAEGYLPGRQQCDFEKSRKELSARASISESRTSNELPAENGLPGQRNHL